MRIIKDSENPQEDRTPLTFGEIRVGDVFTCNNNHDGNYFMVVDLRPDKRKKLGRACAVVVASENEDSIDVGQIVDIHADEAVTAYPWAGINFKEGVETYEEYDGSEEGDDGDLD